MYDLIEYWNSATGGNEHPERTLKEEALAEWEAILAGEELRALKVGSPRTRLRNLDLESNTGELLSRFWTVQN